MQNMGPVGGDGLLQGLYADMHPGPYIERECAAHRAQMQVDSALNAITSETSPQQFAALFGQIPLEKGRGDDGATALHIAAAKGNVPLIRHLIDQKSSLLSVLDAAGNNALAYAVVWDQYQAACELIHAKIDPNIASSQEWSVSISPSCERSYLAGTTPMLIALCTPALRNYSSFVSLLFQSGARVPQEAMKSFLKVQGELLKIEQASRENLLRV